MWGAAAIIGSKGTRTARGQSPDGGSAPPHTYHPEPPPPPYTAPLIVSRIRTIGCLKLASIYMHIPYPYGPTPHTYMHDERKRLLDANRLHKLPDGPQVRALAAVEPCLRHGAVAVTDPVRSNGVVALPSQEP